MHDDNNGPATQVTENLSPTGDPPTSEVQLETLEQLREAIGLLAAESVNQKKVIEAMGELLKGMDARINLLTSLVDNHQATLEGRKTPRGSFDA